MSTFWNTTTNLFSKYIYGPISSAFDFNKGDPFLGGGGMDIGTKSVTIGSVAKDFAGGFLGTMIGRSGTKAQPYRPVEMPKPPKINAPTSTAGNVNFRSTPVDLARDFGLTQGVKQNLAKAAYSEVPSIKNIVDTLVRNARRRNGVKTRLGTQSVGSYATSTPMPYSRKPKYFGGS